MVININLTSYDHKTNSSDENATPIKPAPIIDMTTPSNVIAKLPKLLQLSMSSPNVSPTFEDIFWPNEDSNPNKRKKISKAKEVKFPHVGSNKELKLCLKEEQERKEKIEVEKKQRKIKDTKSCRKKQE